MTPASEEELRLGIVGYGRIAERGWLPAIERVQGVRLAALADSDAQRLASAPAGCERASGAAELASSGGVDVVVVATPPEAHLDDCAALAGAGIQTVVEKPPALDAAQTRALAELRPEPWVGLNRRFDPGVLALKAKAQAKRPASMSLEFTYRRADWGAYRADVDPVLDLGPHLADLALWLAGAPVLGLRASRPAAARVLIEMELEGVTARLVADIDSDYRERYELLGPDGERIGLHTKEAGLRARLRRPWAGPPDPLGPSIAAQLEAVARAVRTGTAGDLVRASGAVRTMAALDAARRSQEADGAWVDVSGESAAASTSDTM